MAANSVDVIRVQPATHRDDILRVLKQNLPAAGSRKRFDWLYLLNPDGQALVWVAYANNGDPVGTSAAIPRLIRVGDTVVRGLVLGDFAVDPAYRSLGPALKLLRSTLLPISEGEFELSYDYPSQSMYAIYRRMGAQSLGNEHRYVRLLSLIAVMRSHLGDGILAAISSKFVDVAIRLYEISDGFPHDVIVKPFVESFDDELWRFSTEICGARKISVDRNPSYLNWRFRQHPERDHTVLVARRNGELVGYVILHRRDEETLGIDEFVCLPDDDIRRDLMSSVLRIARSINVVRIQCAVLENTPVESILKKSGFSFRGLNIGPVVFTGPTSDLRTEINDRYCWWLGEGDRDG